MRMDKEKLLQYIATLQGQKQDTYIKTAQFSFGSPALGTNGTVSGYFARYERIADSYGDVCRRGFLNESIKRREASGHPFPLCYQHDLNQIIGIVKSIEDRPAGAFMVAEFFDTDRAQEVRKMIQSGTVYQMSFAYRTLDAGIVTLPDGKKANELRECELYEISITPTPAQPLSVITDVKGIVGQQKLSVCIRERGNPARRQALLSYIDRL